MKPQSTWTFMVYMGGDNRLENYGVADLREMKKIGSNDRMQIIAQFDGMSDSKTRRYRLTESKYLADDLVLELPEVNTGDPEALIAFINWSITEYPACHYALVLWNHGSGWKEEQIYQSIERVKKPAEVSRGQIRAISAGRSSRALFLPTIDYLVGLSNERAILYDDSSADFLDNIELKKVMEKVVENIGKSIDLLGFDACLMNMIEIVYQVQENCRIVVGSQETEPGDGWPYDVILAGLAADLTMTPETLAKVIVQSYGSWYKNNYPILNITQSAVHSSQIKPLAEAINHLADVLITLIPQQKFLAMLFNTLRSVQGFSDRDYVDLGDLCHLLSKDDFDNSLSKAAKTVCELLEGKDSPIISQVHSGAQVGRASGLSIYLPVRILSPLYNELDFAKQNHWEQFLHVLVQP